MGSLPLYGGSFARSYSVNEIVRTGDCLAHKSMRGDLLPEGGHFPKGSGLAPTGCSSILAKIITHMKSLFWIYPLTQNYYLRKIILK